MYNPDGTDTGREWVEVYNSGSTSVDLVQYKVLENAVNHKISEYSGGTILDANQYAVIADNPEKFLLDYSISGTLIFDSAFSLNNTGEELKLIDENDAEINSVIYSVDLGANDTGNSLQINSNIWIPAEPTPGAVNKTEPVDETPVDDSGSDSDNNSSGSPSGSTNSGGTTSTHDSQTDLSKFKPKIKFEISAGRNRYVSINTPIEFELKHNQDKNTGINAIWSTGDGNIKRGRKISHVFDRPGEYNLVVNAAYQKEQSVSRVKIYVSEPQISLALSTRGETVDLLLKNSGKKEVNIGGFTIKGQNGSFKIARDTIISAGQTLAFSSAKTTIEYGLDTLIYYPNGDKLSVEVVSN